MTTLSSTDALLATAQPLSQGAEAKVYKSTLHGHAVVLKHRFAKGYRHPTLDGTLTRSRVAGEARVLLRCLRAGVSVPGIRFVDAAAGVLGVEWIDGRSVRALLGAGEEGNEEEDEEGDLLGEYGVSAEEVMAMVGTEIGKMHVADVVHGDLTTSNVMLRRRPTTAVVLIDFGLASTSALAEDKAVDLYVLERALGATHADAGPLFACVLAAYAATLGGRAAAVLRKLDDVRLRGRKRSMVG